MSPKTHEMEEDKGENFIHEEERSKHDGDAHEEDNFYLVIAANKARNPC